MIIIRFKLKENINMTEKEKMISGLLYDAHDKELVEARTFARQLAIDYNRTNEHEQKERQEILNKLLGSIGENVLFEPTIRFDYGFNTTVGDNCAFNFNSVILDVAPLNIGNNVLAGHTVSI